LLCQEYVLVQAWKKTASHIRSHNWYADTLALDRAAVNLPDFIQELVEHLQGAAQWANDPLRIVPAPKSQTWRVDATTNRWEPVNKRDTARKLRPLARVSLKDQVAATALMLCLADRVETAQGNPTVSVESVNDRRAMISYGNRLFCDSNNAELRHRWGSTKLYRGYFQDYRRFLSRPEAVAEPLARDVAGKPGQNLGVVIVHSDLRQFYDRVRPELLAAKIDSLRLPGDDLAFFEMVRRVLCWGWSDKDQHEVIEYATKAELTDFTKVALPQGLVAAGFFSNVVLLDFDKQLRLSIENELVPGVVLRDACRYVDDIRLVLTIQGKPDLRRLRLLEAEVVGWLQALLNQTANGLVPSAGKTKGALFRGDERPLVRQSRKMERIQHAISGGFDAIGGEDILDAVQGLVKSQSRYSKDRAETQGWSLAPIPDVRDETVARFAAARFRSTFRSLRPLLEDETAVTNSTNAPNEERSASPRQARSRIDLDDEARAFALGLIENWVEDPSNVRLLRIGLDLWPAADVLERVLQLLRQYVEPGGRRKEPRRVAWYCLSEVFRAGATETGFVEDQERLPYGIDINAYRTVLAKEAEHLLTLPAISLPWYLKQQVLLFLAANNPDRAPVLRKGSNPETKHYRALIRFLKGDPRDQTDREFATLAILSRRSFLDVDRAVGLVNAHLTPHKAQLIAERDPSFALELFASNQNLVQGVAPRIRYDLCLGPHQNRAGWTSLAELVLAHSEALRNELAILQFMTRFLDLMPFDGGVEAITPGEVLVRFGSDGFPADVDIVPNKQPSADGSLYQPPPWCQQRDRWRHQLGYLLRFILSAQQDFTKSVRPAHWKEGLVTYRVPQSHWYQRIYGFHSGHTAFGADWLPITDWTERLLYVLLSWPGCRTSNLHGWVDPGIEETRARIAERIRELSRLKGPLSNVLMLPLSAPWPERPTESRPLRVCVVQTVIPGPTEFKPADLRMSDPATRRRHRNHLSAALAAVERMLDLRETHKARANRLDWLILPELSVHPRDVETHLVPFARAHKTIIFAGLTYEEILAGQPLINSALWVIPVWSFERGLEVLRRRQGKKHLALEEQQLNSPIQLVQGFRPCQWLVGYEWHTNGIDRPLWLTGSVCYDATDIQLAADLRNRSDIFAVPACNRDVNTFDQMALALHYHMFQMVIVANNGTFGGSNAYAPYREAYTRQVFHLHGQPQASIAFLEIDDIRAFLRRGEQGTTVGGPWKHVPAGFSPEHGTA
jgi:hypothetical protein